MATQRRILDAAAEEFAARGLAGARIERITAAARTNKAQVYGYFASKEGLFDAVLADRVERSTDAVPFDATDLAAWAVALYDQSLHEPELVRLIAWTRLEQRPTGRWFDGAEHDPKLDAVAQAQRSGRVRDGDPLDLLALVVAMAGAWSPTSGVYAATRDEDPAEHDRRRALLRESVTLSLAPAAPQARRTTTVRTANGSGNR